MSPNFPTAGPQKPPQKVEGHEGGEPVTVVVEEPEETPAQARTQMSQEKETGLRTEGQRRINLIWEYTQAVVTVLITSAAIFCAVRGIDAQVLNFAFVAVISTYYARTKVGGVGRDWEGR